MKIGIAIIHGIGTQKKDYADVFIEKLKKRYSQLNGQCNLEFEAVCWQESIAPLEEDLFDKIKELNWPFLRSLFVGYAGDAIGYQPSEEDSGFYTTVHQSLDSSLTKLASRLDKDSPLCIISHSLGSVVASNFIWDAQNGSKFYTPTKTSIDLIRRLELLYTMGSPIAVWSLRFPNGGLPISIPNIGNWYNLYNTNDVISSPLKIINQHYKVMPNLFDIDVKVGGWKDSWNPAAHNAYWDSKSTINHICSKLTNLNKYYSKYKEGLK